jgi:hypothetical protein
MFLQQSLPEMQAPPTLAQTQAEPLSGAPPSGAAPSGAPPSGAPQV